MTDRIDAQFKFSLYGACIDEADGDSSVDKARLRPHSAPVKKLSLPVPGQQLVAERDISGATQRRPLKEGAPSIVELLLRKVRCRLIPDVMDLVPEVRQLGLLDACGTFGLNALMWAASRGYCKLVRFLCQEGAKLDVITDELGEDALILAAKNGHSRVVRILLEESSKDGNFRRHGSPLVRCQNAAGWTALMFAAANGFLKIVELCVAARADVSHHARDGTTPLSWASTFGDREVVAFLVSAGAKPVAKSAKT